MSTNPPSGSDGGSGDSLSPTEQIPQSLRRVGAAYTSKAQSDINALKPQATFDRLGKRIFEGAPTPLKRVFGSPLVLVGTLAGANVVQGVRKVTDGWGSNRVAQQGALAVSGTRTHKGLDFAAPVGEPVLASGDGTLTFIGYQPASGRGSIVTTDLHADEAGVIRNAAGTQLAVPGGLGSGGIGFGGIFVQIHHRGNDFDGYITEYMHLSAISSKAVAAFGKDIFEGDVIGYVGRTGGNNGLISAGGSHLHWQVRWRDYTPVNPTVFVPHLWNNHEFVAADGTYSGDTGTAVANISASQTMSLAQAMMTTHAANQLVALARQTGLANVSGAGIKSQQGDHATLVAANVNNTGRALYDVIARYQGQQPTIQNGLAFDFDSGLWTDGKTTPIVPAAGAGI